MESKKIMPNISLDLDNLLKEDNFLQAISFPKINQKIIKIENGAYIFENQETFNGKILEGILKKGKYTWPNGQIYFGDLSPFNTFNKRGKIIFPDKSVLTGFFDGKNNTIDKATYISPLRIYEGSFKNNKLNGKFIIRNKDEKQLNYLYIGQYFNGAKHGKFELKKIYKNKNIKNLKII